MNSLKHKKISVIIPTLNAEIHIKSLLIALHGQSLKPFETIVIDSSSSDKTIETAKSLGAKVVVIQKKDFDHGRTRNHGANIAAGDIIVYMTQDCLPADFLFLENLIAPLSDPAIPLSYARQLPKEDANPVEKFARFFNYPQQALIKDNSSLATMGIKTFFCSNVASAVRKKEFEYLGCFPEKTITGEDMFFAAKAIEKGYKIAYQPSAKVFHSHTYSLIQQFKRYFDAGVSLNMNRWILGLAKPEKEGGRFLKEEVKFLIKNGSFLWIPYGLVDAVMRFAGYHVGYLEGLMPKSLKKALSMNSDFWK